MNDVHYAFGIDIGGTNTKIGFFDHRGTLLTYHHIPTDKTISAEAFIEKIAQESFALIEERGFKKGDPRIIGIGAGAPMANYYTGMVSEAPNLGWKHVPLRALFARAFAVPAVIENDANLAAVGEKRWGAGRDLADFVLITLGTGVGAGLILGNKLYRGHNALGAEGGHVLIPHEKKRLCSCGGMNHLESFLSAAGIKQTIFELTGEHWTIEKLGTLYHEGNQRAVTIIHTVAEELASGLTSMAVLMGPEAFIIGGGVSKLGTPFNDVIREKLDQLVHFSLKGKIRIISATVSSDKGAIFGGAAHIFEEVRK
jgi:glucokinase